MDEQERGESKLEAYELEDMDEKLVLVGGRGPVPYKNLLTEEEYQAFRELAEKKEPTDAEVARGQALLRLMMDRYPEGPGAK